MLTYDLRTSDPSPLFEKLYRGIRGDILSGASGIYMNATHIYTQDRYAAAEVEALKAGDTIIVEGEEVPVLSVTEADVESGSLISVNDGQDAREFYLSTIGDSSDYAVHGLDDMTTYTEQGATTLVIDPAATFTDAWDIESEPVTVGYDGIVEAMQTSENDAFIPENTTVRVEGGKVVEINRAYIP